MILNDIKSFVIKLVSSTNHKDIGTLYFFGAVFWVLMLSLTSWFFSLNGIIELYFQLYNSIVILITIFFVCFFINKK